MVGIGFFSPLPLAYMVPFMVAQSLAMMEAAGRGWQFGKRKISAMPNKEFNKLEYIDMWNDSTANVRDMLPGLEKMFDTSTIYQGKIFEHMFALIPVFINKMAESTGGLISNLSGQNADWSTFWEQFAQAHLPAVPEIDATPGKTIPPPDKKPELTEDIPIKDELEEDKKTAPIEYIILYKYWNYAWDDRAKLLKKKTFTVTMKHTTKVSANKLLRHIQAQHKRQHEAFMNITVQRNEKKMHDRHGQHSYAYHIAEAKLKTLFSRQFELRNTLRRMGLYER